MPSSRLAPGAQAGRSLINEGTYTAPSSGYSLPRMATMGVTTAATFRPATEATAVIAWYNDLPVTARSNSSSNASRLCRVAMNFADPQNVDVHIDPEIAFRASGIGRLPGADRVFDRWRGELDDGHDHRHIRDYTEVMVILMSGNRTSASSARIPPSCAGMPVGE